MFQKVLLSLVFVKCKACPRYSRNYQIHPPCYALGQVNTGLSGIIEDTDVQGARMQVNSASITVLLGIESHRVFSYGLRDLPVYRFGGKLEGKAQ